jgi:hypothetical protein
MNKERGMLDLITKLSEVIAKESPITIDIFFNISYEDLEIICYDLASSGNDKVLMLDD